MVPNVVLASLIVGQCSSTGVPRASRVPWGFLVFWKSDFLLQYVNASLWNFLDQLVASRLQVVITYTRGWVQMRKRNAGSCCVTCSLLCN